MLRIFPDLSGNQSLTTKQTSKNITLTFYETPGQSPDSICIFTNDAVFAGDTLLNNTKTPLTFPHSNRKHYATSLQKLRSLLKPGMMVYPGHGEPFVVDVTFLQRFKNKEFPIFDKKLNYETTSDSKD